MQSPRTGTLAVLLAAGAGRRFGGTIHKLRHPLAGRPIVSHAIEAMVASNIGPCLIVTGAVELDDLIGDIPRLHNPDWASGQRSSVCAAIAYAHAHNFDSIVFGLGDQPFVTSDGWRTVANAEGPLVVATYEGKRGNPVKIAHSLWDEFLALDVDPDSGLRSLMRLRPELVKEVACKGNSADIDTPEDLAQWT